MTTKSNKVKELFRTRRIVIPITIGLLVSFYLLWSGTDWNELNKIEWGGYFGLWIFIAFLMVVLRDLAYMYRIRVLTDKEISWRKSFDIIMLWEFSSAVTPGIVGGSGVAVYILHKEGLGVGKSTATVMVTALLDELFYVLTVPFIILIVHANNLFPVELQKKFLGLDFGIKGIFALGYGFTFLLSLIILYAIFINPKRFKRFLVQLFFWRPLKKWAPRILKIGDDIIQTSQQLKSKKFSFWLSAFLATFFAWTSRYWVVNFLILAFTPVGDHLIIYGRQLVMWIIMLISPTPGSTGVAEFAFKGFLAEFIPIGLVGLLSVLWRLLSYYPYLLIGAVVVPRWLKRTHF